MKITHGRIALLVLLLVAALPMHEARAANPNNGAAPRPFYVISHNPNTHDEVINSLNAGANALEPDIEVMNNDLHPGTPKGSLIVYHDSVLLYTRVPETLENYLKFLHGIALQYPQLALIVFDIKPAAATTAHGLEILNLVRTHLNTDGVNLNVVFNVGTRADGAVFDSIVGQLGPREGIVMDFEDDPVGVMKYFGNEKKYWGNVAYADGTLGPGPNLHKAISTAAGWRAFTGYPRAIPYVFTIESRDEMKLFIDNGADGLIPDIANVLAPWQTDQPLYCRLLADIVATRSDVRMATRQDNPFQPQNEAYALFVETGTDSGAGTDATLRFTLTGANGTSYVDVDTGYAGMMENGTQDWVTIPSRDLGPLQSVTVQRMSIDYGGGVAWQVKKITVLSARYLSPRYLSAPNDFSGDNFYQTSPSAWVEDYQTPYSWNLTHDYAVPYADAWADATPYPYLRVPMQFPDGTQPFPWPDFFSAYNYVRPGGTIHLGGGTYHVTNQNLGSGTYGAVGRIDKPGRIVKETSAPYATGSARLALTPN